MKKVIITATLALAAFANTNAQDVQHATLVTSIPTMIALRPYDAYTTATDNQSLSATVTGAADVLSTNNFGYTGNGSYNGLAYKIYSNVTYKVNLQAQGTGSDDELNNYINFRCETLPSPQNGQAPFAPNGNGDHTIEVTTNTRLADATAAPMELLSNSGYNTGKWNGGAEFSPLDPANTDFAAFGIKFSVSPGFSVFPGNYTTNLTITATTL